MDSILIIGDEPDLREKLSSYLTEAGYEVTSVDDYMAARMIIEDLVPDIIVLGEVHENGMDSLATCKHVHGEHGIPVILLGEGPKGEMWEKAVAAGAEYYFKKPVSYEVLAAVVKAILRRYKSTISKSGNDLHLHRSSGQDSSDCPEGSEGGDG